MIDLHCHLLPGIDDGAKTIDDSIAMAKYAVESGITHSVLTPHLHLSRYENFANDIRDARDELASSLNRMNIPLKLGYAAEVRICPEIMIWIDKNKIPFLGTYEGYKVMLVEMPHNQLLPGWDNLFRWLLNNKVRPMIAHPERNKEIMAMNEKVIPLVNAGALIQLTAGSVAGKFGEASTKTAEFILKQDLCTILASDAHNLKHRPPTLEEGRQQVEQLIGESKSWDMVVNIPQQISAIQFQS